MRACQIRFGFAQPLKGDHEPCQEERDHQYYTARYGSAHAPAPMNRESPSEGGASEGTFPLCCCACCVVVIIYSLSILWLLRARLGYRIIFVSPSWSPVSATYAKVGWRRVLATYPDRSSNSISLYRFRRAAALGVP